MPLKNSKIADAKPDAIANAAFVDAVFVEKRGTKATQKEREGLNKILKDIQKGVKIKIADISAISWIWYEIYARIKFIPSDYDIPKKIEMILRNGRLKVAEVLRIRLEYVKLALRRQRLCRKTDRI